MKEKLTMIYTCEHCGKYYKRKHFALRHEKYCPKNPDNKHACFEDCIYLNKETLIEEYDNSYYTQETKRIQFTCEVTDKLMHSYIAERLNIAQYGEDLGERMPLKCENYKHCCQGIPYDSDIFK